MIKRITILTFFAIALSTNLAFAKNVSEQEARRAAACYMNNLENGKIVDENALSLIYQIDNPELNIPACYFFNVADWGWIIMSASTVTDPIVAYNDNGMTLNINEAPENMMWWVNGYAALISAKQVEDAKYTLDEDKTWYELWDNSYTTPKNGSKANIILLQEAWGQGGNSGDTYNIFCPRDEDGVPTVTGCVATALSQIMHYYKFPKQGKGINGYRWHNQTLRLAFDTMFFDYSLMPNIINSSTTLAQRSEISRLCYAAGVAINMDYGTIASGGSAAASAAVPNVMFVHFKYKKCTQIYRDNVGDSTFLAQIRSELELNRPVYMSGASTSHVGNDDRHAFVCDGYKTNQKKMYHFNWGWESSGDGYYNLYDNSATGMRIPGEGYSFTDEQSAMIGLIPPHPDSTAIDFMPNHEGINDATLPELYSAYPNPATHSITLPYSIQNTENMIIYNVEGKIMEQHTLQPADDHININVTNMPAGIYTYRVGGATGKFIVQ